MFCLISRSVPAYACCLHTNERFSLHMLRVFLNASLKNSGDALFKSRSVPVKSRFVPACAVCLHTNERFSLHMLRVFFNASLKNSWKLCLKGGLSLHVLFVCTPLNVFVCTCCEFFLTLSLKKLMEVILKEGLSPFYLLYFF